MKRASVFLIAFALTACNELDQPTAPDVGGPAFSAQAVTGSYIVVFHPTTGDVPGLAHALTRAHGGTITFTYEHALRGFAAQLPPQAVAALRNNPNVAYIEEDQVVWASATQNNATWGLDRIDQRNLPLSTTYTYAQTGAGVNAYIIDTGIRITHNDFGGRALAGFDAVTSGGTANDCNGHGTHVAGTVGGTTWGVAKGVKLYAVRVLGCNGSGTTSGVIAGVNWVTSNHVKPAVANMSLGGGASLSLDQAVQNSINAGVTYVLAAGNETTDACTRSPARVGAAITIGSTTSSDARSSFSNFGNCVDFFAPGSSITSAYHSSNTAAATMSGTSMAAPHAAGAAALYLQTNAGATPQQVRDALYNATTKGKVTGSQSTNNHLLYTPPTGFGGGEPANQPPVASFGSSCANLVCSFTDTSTDSDGSVVAWSWSFGDGATSTLRHPSRTYAAAGSYVVSLTVTDNQGATNSKSATIQVTAPPEPPAGISLSVRAYKVQGLHRADLTWAGATTANVDIYRDGSLLTTRANTGAWTDLINARGSGTYAYRVCEAGSSTCSPTVNAVF
jgi:subtilisin family serine protease